MKKLIALLGALPLLAISGGFTGCNEKPHSAALAAPAVEVTTVTQAPNFTQSRFHIAQTAIF